MGQGCTSGSWSFSFKKKDLVSSSSGTQEKSTPSTFKSIFDGKRDFYIPAPAQFFPPEAFDSVWSSEGGDSLADLKNLTQWDIATRYHEFKSKKSLQHLARALRKVSAAAVLERAQEILGAVVHPMNPQVTTLAELPPQAEQVDFDLDETLENSVLSVVGQEALTEQDIFMSYSTPRQYPLVLCVDTSLSMTGEKLALTAVALAVVLLEFPHDPIGIVAFENEAKTLKSPEERLSIEALVERFLDVPAQGYTHLEEGMRSALSLVKSARALGRGAIPSTVLLTDGKYTAGRDPAYLAGKFPHLIVLKMGKERASLELCRELARKGQGTLKEVDDLESLPSVMYGVVKSLLLGHSLG